MAKFFVGQRVKKVRGAHNLGFEGVVVGVACYGAGSMVPSGVGPMATLGDRSSDLQIKYASDWLNTDGAPFPCSRIAYGKAENFEPIQPDGAQPSEFTTLRDLLTSLEGVHA